MAVNQAAQRCPGRDDTWFAGLNDAERADALAVLARNVTQAHPTQAERGYAVVASDTRAVEGALSVDRVAEAARRSSQYRAVTAGPDGAASSLRAAAPSVSTRGCTQAPIAVRRRLLALVAPAVVQIAGATQGRNEGGSPSHVRTRNTTPAARASWVCEAPVNLRSRAGCRALGVGRRNGAFTRSHGVLRRP